MRDVEEFKLTLMASTIIFAEVYESDLTEDARTKFDDLFKRRNVIPVEVDVRTARLAGKIREHYAKQTPAIEMYVPDAIHLASAIIWKANELHTFDGAGKRKRRADLLPMSGNVMGHNLLICTPYAAQLALQPQPQPALPIKQDEDAEEEII